MRREVKGEENEWKHVENEENKGMGEIWLGRFLYCRSKKQKQKIERRKKSANQRTKRRRKRQGRKGQKGTGKTIRNKKQKQRKNGKSKKIIRQTARNQIISEQLFHTDSLTHPFTLSLTHWTNTKANITSEIQHHVPFLSYTCRITLASTHHHHHHDQH